MAQQHDIVLTLQAQQFETQINKAYDLLIALDEAARQVQKSLTNAFGKIDISGATSQIKALGDSIQNLGSVKVDTSDGIKKITTDAQSAIKDVDALGAKLKETLADTGKTPTLVKTDNLPKAVSEIQQTDVSIKKLASTTGEANKVLTDSSKVIVDLSTKLATLSGNALKVKLPDINTKNLFTGTTVNPDFTKPLFDGLIKVGSAVKNANTGLEELTQKAVNNLEKKVQSRAFNDFRDSLGGIGTQAGNAKTLLDALTHSLGVGLAHSFGAVIAGANVLVSLLHEIPRNLAIGAFNFFFKKAVDGFGETTNAVEKTGEASVKAAGQVKTLTQSLAEGGSAGGGGGAGGAGGGGGFGEVFRSIDKGAVILSGTLLLLGIILDKIGEKILTFTEGLAHKAGDANLAFTQLNAVIEATSSAIGASLGPTEQWAKFIQDLALKSGTSRKELADFATAFTQIGADAGLSGLELQKLVEIAAFTKDRFRNATEQLTNFRQALAGNVRFLQNNIPIGTTLNDVTQKYAEILQRQGASQAEATKQAKEAGTAQKVLGALEEASIPFIKTATETTGSYSIELRKLKASIENLQISLGSGIEPIFATITKAARDFVNGLANLPKGVQNTIGVFVTFAGIIAEVGGKLLKLVGIVGLVVAAYTTLNKVILVTIPLLGNSLAGIASNALALGGPVKQLTSLKEILIATGGAAKTYFTELTAGTSVLGLIGSAFVKLGQFIGGTIGQFATLANILSVLKFATLIGFVIAAVEAFQKLNENGDATRGILEVVNIALGTASQSFTDLADAMGVSERAGAAFQLVAGLIQRSLTGIAYAANLASLALLKRAAAQTKSSAERARAAGDLAEATKQTLKNEELSRSIQRTENALDALELSYKKLNVTQERNSAIITGSAQDLAALKREAVDTGDSILILGRKINEALSADQVKILDRLVKSLRGEIDQLNVRRIEIVSGKGPAEAAKALLKVKEAIREINATPGPKLFTDDEIDGAKSVKVLLDKLGKTNPEQAREIGKALDLAGPLAAGNDALERQKKLFSEIITSANALGDAFSKEVKAAVSAVDLQNQFNKAIGQTTDDFDRLVKRATLEQEVRKTTLEIDNRIQEVRDRISKGKIEVQSTGQTIRVELSAKEKQQANADLDKLTKDRNVLISTKIDEASAKQVGETIAEFQRRGEAITKIFQDDANSLNDQRKLIDAYTKDLEKGTKFAEDQQAIRVKDLDITNKIRDAQREILDLSILLKDPNLNTQGKAQLQDLKDQQEALIARLRVQKDINEATAEENQLRKSEQDILANIKKTNESLTDQLNLLEARAQLFKEGILSGDFNKTQARIDILTSALEGLLAEQIRIKREAETNPGILTDKVTQQTLKNLDEIKSALRNAQFIADIREILQAIPDAFEEALTEGVRGVLQGTMKISDLFRQMASNIFLSLSKTFAQRAVKIVGDSLDDMSKLIAESDLMKQITDFLGVDIGKAFKGIGAAKSPQEQLKEAVTSNTSILETVNASLRDLIRTLGGGGAAPKPTEGQTPNQPLPGTAQVPTTITTPPFTVTPEQNILGDTSGSDLFDQFTEDFVNGFEEAKTTITETTTSLTTNVGQQVQLALANIGTNVDNILIHVDTAIDDGFNVLENNADFTPVFESLDNSLQAGVESTARQSEGLFGSFFNFLKELIGDGLAGLSGGSGGKKQNIGVAIGFAIVKGIASYYGGSSAGSLFPSSGSNGVGAGLGANFNFGNAKGGMIGGFPSKKDNQILPIASGEYVTNSDAVSYYGKDFFDKINNMQIPPNYFQSLDQQGATAQVSYAAPKASQGHDWMGNWKQQQQPQMSDDRPINVTIIDKAPKLDPEAFKMKPSEVTQIVVDGIRHDRVIRKVIHEDRSASRGN